MTEQNQNSLQVKEAAQQLAEFFYREFQREKRLQQQNKNKIMPKPTYHDKLKP